MALATRSSALAASAVERGKVQSLCDVAAGLFSGEASSLASGVFCERLSVPRAVGAGGPAGEGAADCGALVVSAEREDCFPLSASCVDPVPRVLTGRALILQQAVFDEVEAQVEA